MKQHTAIQTGNNKHCLAYYSLFCDYVEYLIAPLWDRLFSFEEQQFLSDWLSCFLCQIDCPRYLDKYLLKVHLLSRFRVPPELSNPPVAFAYVASLCLKRLNRSFSSLRLNCWWLKLAYHSDNRYSWNFVWCLIIALNFCSLWHALQFFF